MSDAAATPPRLAPISAWHSRTRFLWILLIVSLAANLFVVGAVSRVIWPTRYMAASAGQAGMLGNLFAYSKELPKERRSEIRKGFSEERPMRALQPFRKDLREARLEAARQFRHEPFSREDFLAAESQVISAEVKLREATARMAADIAQRMTADERGAFLKWRELRRLGGPAVQQDTRTPATDAPK